MKSSSSSKSQNRCHHFSPSGRQCSQPICSSSPTFCFVHKPPATNEDKLLLQELTQAAGSLDSPEDVSRVLGKVFMALLQDRISLKKAGTLGFLGQMLIRSHREIEYYKKTHLQNEEEAEAHERHLLFLKQQDERKARLEARDAELRRQAAEQAEQAAIAAKKAAREAAKSARKEARETARKRAATSESVAQASACVPVECGSSAAAFRSNEANPLSKDDRPSQAAIASQKQPPPTIVQTASPQPSSTPPPPQPDLNHFFPFDPTLAPGRQDPTKNIPPPDAEELRWRQLSRQYAHARRRH